MSRRTRADPGLFNAKRRREIIAHARHVGAAGTEDFERWLIAWVWQNPAAKDQVWAVMEAAKRMGGEITETGAEAVIEAAGSTWRRKSADNMARWLGLTYDVRQALGITTIGSVNVTKRVRKELRKFRNNEAKLRKRRASGAIARAEYEANSLSATQPWRELGMSRRTWERRRNKARDASAGTAILLSSEDVPASAGTAEQGFALKEVRRLTSRDGVHRAVPAPFPGYSALPLELRLMALGLSVAALPLAVAA